MSFRNDFTNQPSQDSFVFSQKVLEKKMLVKTKLNDCSEDGLI